MVDTLHKSNPWENSLCERKSCLPCSSSIKELDEAIKNFKKRSIVYQTLCHTCKSKLKGELLDKLKKENKEKESDEKAGKWKRNTETVKEKRKEEERMRLLEKELEGKNI